MFTFLSLKSIGSLFKNKKGVFILSIFIFFLVDNSFSQEIAPVEFYPHRIIMGEERVYITSFGHPSSIYALDKRSDVLAWQSSPGDIPDEKFFKKGVVNRALKEIYLPGQLSGYLLFVKDLGESMELAAQVYLDKEISLIDFDDEKNKIFVANDRKLFIVDAGERKILNTVEFRGVTIRDLFLNKESNHLYLIDDAGNKLLVVDGNEGRIIKEIPVNKEPGTIEYNPLLRKIYIVSNPGNSVSIVNVENWEIKTLPTGFGPLFSSVNDKTGAVYITNNRSHSLSVIGRQDIITTLDLPPGVQPGAIKIDSERRRIYVEDIADKRMLVLNEEGEILAAIAIKRVADDLALDNETGRLLVPVSSLKSIVVVRDDRAERIIGDEMTFNSAGPLFLDGPVGMVVDEQNDILYIATGRKGALISYETKNLALKNKLDINPEISYLRITEEERMVALIDLSGELVLTDGLQILQRIKIGKSPCCMVEVNNRLFIANKEDKFVSVVNLISRMMEKNIPLEQPADFIGKDEYRQEVYVKSPGDSSISIIDASKGEVKNRVKFDENILTFSVDKDASDFLYVLLDSGNLALIDLNKNEVAERIPLNRVITGMSYEVLGGRLFLLDKSGREVIGLDIRTRGQKIFEFPWSLTSVFPSKEPLLLYFLASNDFGFGAIDLKTDSVFFARVGSRPTAVRYDKENNRVFVANFSSNSIDILSGKDYSYVGSILSDGTVRWVTGGTPRESAAKKIAWGIPAVIILLGLGLFLWRKFKTGRKTV